MSHKTPGDRRGHRKLWGSQALVSLFLLTSTLAAAEVSIFEERAANTGLVFTHFNGMSGELYFSEMVGSGAALFDYDKDGDLDVYLVQGHMLGSGKTVADYQLEPRQAPPFRDRLFRNELVETGELRFTDVTEASGIDARRYGMGVAVGDVDNDGCVDLYVTNWGPNQLWANRCNGTFEEVTAAAGVEDARWSISASFTDYDADGWLDLYVGDYVSFTLENHKSCALPSGARDYCGPLAYPAEPDRLFRNEGDGTFQDVSASSGIAARPGTGLGAAAADYDGDGDIDLYVANDQMVNFLWLNRGDGTFRDDAPLAGTAVNAAGLPEASMGVAVQDYDDDADPDVFLTHLNGETNTLYVNDGEGLFVDRTLASGLGPPSLPFTSFGTSWIDYDNDGWLDLLVVSGEVKIVEEHRRAGDPHPLNQTNQLFHNTGGRFEDVTASAGKAFELVEVSRGAAFGDVDNDGDVDAVVTNNGGPVRLLLNRVGNRNRWLGLRLLDPRWKRDAIGAVANLELADGRTLTRRVHTDGSYASASDSRLLFGLGEDSRPKIVRVRWPDGRVELFGPLASSQYHSLRRGAGRPAGSTRGAEP